MLYIIYPYRNRELKRIENSLNSLKNQTNKSFTVYFVDSGTEHTLAKDVENLVNTYDFVTYVYHNTQHQPWNKSLALNSVIKSLDGGFCFVADVDMIFRNDFVEIANQLQKPNKATYFKVGFLDQVETQRDKEFEHYNIKFESTSEATGLTMFPVENLKKIHGFDEFYHFWGSEDTDVHVRLKHSGCDVQFYDKNILMLHQWHESYRIKEQDKLTKELQLSHIVRLNYRHLNLAIDSKKTIVNKCTWGNVLTKSQFQELETCDTEMTSILNTLDRIQHFLYVEFHNLEPGIYRFRFYSNSSEKSLKQKLKKHLGKENEVFLTMKEVNDMVLLHIISFYRNKPYTYKVNDKLQELYLTITL